MAPLNGPPVHEIELVCPAAGAFRVALEGVEATAEETINNSAAKKVLDSLYAEGGDPEAWVEKLGLKQTRDSGEIEAVVDAILNANPHEVTRFCAGEEKVLKFLTGQIMREGKGKFPADMVQQVLGEKIKTRCG